MTTLTCVLLYISMKFEQLTVRVELFRIQADGMLHSGCQLVFH